MTEMTDGLQCVDCMFYAVPSCDNSNSDHYGHMLESWHPACSHHTTEEETHHAKCAIHDGGECDCDNPD